jgi:hypothetical protein
LARISKSKSISEGQKMAIAVLLAIIIIIIFALTQNSGKSNSGHWVEDCGPGYFGQGVRCTTRYVPGP